MDSKNIKNPRLADLSVSTQTIVAAVKDIPGAVINAGNVEIDLAEFSESGEASVVVGEALLAAGHEVASLSVALDIATLDFTTALTSADIIRVVVKQNL